MQPAGDVLQFDASKVARSKEILFPAAPPTSTSPLIVGTEYLDDPQREKLKKIFADPRIAQYLKTTDDPLVQSVLTPVSAD